MTSSKILLPDSIILSAGTSIYEFEEDTRIQSIEICITLYRYTILFKSSLCTSLFFMTDLYLYLFSVTERYQKMIFTFIKRDEKWK